MDVLSSNMHIAQSMFNKDRHYWMYAGLEQDEIFFQFPGQTWTDDEYSPIKRHWYQDTKDGDTDNVNFIEPYADYNTGNLAFTSTKKITKNGEFIGVAALDELVLDVF